jgi:hypothetical protein
LLPWGEDTSSPGAKLARYRSPPVACPEANSRNLAVPA